jgi:transposase
MPIRVIITAGPVADCSQTCALIEGFDSEKIFADRGYDTNEFIEAIEASGAEFVIPPNKNRKHQSEYDRFAYKLRHLVENAFLHFKQWRGAQPDMPRTRLRSLLLFIFDASPCGLKSRDDTI